jgi:peptidoglycan/LPS O-acetylase OafA/YrhL
MPESMDAAPVILAERPGARPLAAPPRDLYIDRLRSVMTACVIFHHTAITYGAVGGWFYYEFHPSSSISSLLLTMFCATQQAYFMGFFFLLAGYFTPGSLERKGYARFIGDRFLRLGLPLLVFVLFLNPLTDAIAAVGRGHSFWRTIEYYWDHRIVGNGPLWFAQALLIFSLGYCAWRATFGSRLSESARTSTPVPAYRSWLLSALGVGAVALAIRQFVPTGVNIMGLQLGYFSSYTFLFAIGIAAWRCDWLRQLEWKRAQPWIVALIVAWPCLPIGIAVASAHYGPGKASFGGGFSWPSVLYAFWEPFVAWGLIAAWLLIFRERMNQPSQLWSWLNRRAYAVYIIHPPVLVGMALLLHAWPAPPLVKFAVTGTLSCVASWLIADSLVRLPGVRRVV